MNSESASGFMLDVELKMLAIGREFRTRLFGDEVEHVLADLLLQFLARGSFQRGHCGIGGARDESAGWVGLDLKCQTRDEALEVHCEIVARAGQSAWLRSSRMCGGTSLAVF